MIDDDDEAAVAYANNIACAAIIGEWSKQLNNGSLTGAGLLEVRRRLRTDEFECRPEAQELLRSFVGQIMHRGGMTAWHVPDEEPRSTTVPDDAAALLGGGPE